MRIITPKTINCTHKGSPKAAGIAVIAIETPIPTIKNPGVNTSNIARIIPAESQISQCIGTSYANFKTKRV